MNHTKYMELLERVESELEVSRDIDNRNLAIAIVEALLPELDRPDWSPADSNALTQLGVLVKLGAEQHAELTRLVTRMQGSMEKLNTLQQRLTERVDLLEREARGGNIFGPLGAELPKDWTIASIMHHDSICHVCKSPKRACRCPTL